MRQYMEFSDKDFQYNLVVTRATFRVIAAKLENDSHLVTIPDENILAETTTTNNF